MNKSSVAFYLLMNLCVAMLTSNTRAQGVWMAENDSGYFYGGVGISALTLGEKVYIVGFDSLEVLDSLTHSWSIPKDASSYIPGNGFSLDTPNSGYYQGTSSELDQKIYSFGGYHASSSRLVPEKLHVLDIETLYWSEPQTSGAFTSRQDLISAVVGGKIYAIGGNADTGLSENTLFSTIEIFDPSISTWSTPVTNGSLIPAEGQCGCALNGKIYVFGGAQSGSNSLILTPNQVFDPSTSTWSLISSKGMFGRWYASACALNGKICLVGGQAIGPDTQGSWFNDTALAGTGNDGTQRYIQIYDPATDSWNTPYTSGTFDGVFMAAATVFNGKIYVFGGDNGEITNELQVFTPGSDDVNEPKPVDNLSLYPNPTTGSVTITGAIGPVSVINVLGQQVFNTEGTRLDLSRLPAGTYFVRIETPDGFITRKILKE